MGAVGQSATVEFGSRDEPGGDFIFAIGDATTARRTISTSRPYRSIASNCFPVNRMPLGTDAIGDATLNGCHWGMPLGRCHWGGGAIVPLGTLPLMGRKEGRRKRVASPIRATVLRLDPRTSRTSLTPRLHATPSLTVGIGSRSSLLRSVGNTVAASSNSRSSTPFIPQYLMPSRHPPTPVGDGNTRTA